MTAIDSSAPALALADGNVALNGFDAARHRAIDADVNQTLRALLDVEQSFDAIVLDPPKLAPTVAHAERAARAYKDINRLALLAAARRAARSSPSRARAASTPTCSTRSSPAPASMPASTRFIHARLGAAPDHPMTVNFPEGEYLKGLVLIKR